MAKTDFTKTMRNIDVSAHPRSGGENRQRDIYQLKVKFTQQDKAIFHELMKSELNYYNTLNESIGSRARTSPASIINLSNNWMKLYGQLAYLGINLEKLADKQTRMITLTEELKPFESLLNGVDAKGERYLNERTLMILDTVGGGRNSASLHPEVRKVMALEILKFYQEQAKLISQAIPSSHRNDLVYRNPPSFLESMDSLRKRHVQVPRSITTSVWDEFKKQSRIKIPYLQDEIIFKDSNVADSRWNILIIHQMPSFMVNGGSPWVIDFRFSRTPYLLKYLDQKSATIGTALHEARWTKHGG